MLNPTGVFKERLSQSALYFETTQVPDREAREVRKWMESKGMTVSFLSADQVKAFADVTTPVLEKWAKAIGTELVAKAKADMAK